MKPTLITLLASISLVLSDPIQKDAVQEFESGNRMLTAAIYKELIRRNSGNLIVSPFSVETILSLAYEGARGETATELVNGLYLPDTDEKIQAAYRSVLPKLQSTSDELKIITANKIYIREGAMLEERFQSIASSVYRSGVENIDFSLGSAAAREINMWVEEQTNNKIRNLVDPTSLNANTIMVLVNTLYLSGKWLYPFTYSDLKRRFYRTRDDAIETNTMWQQEYLNYAENENLSAKFLELPLQGGNASMVIVLPYDINGLDILEENVEELLGPQQYTKQVVEVELPSFSIESQIQFLPILENLGIQRVFGPEADLSGISSTDRDFYINDVVQKAYINVTQGGVEATAATESVKTPGMPTIATAVFRANRPFLYYIRNNGVVLFSGRYVNPEEW